MFDLEREDEEEDSGRRSILGLSRIEFARPGRTGVPPPAPEARRPSVLEPEKESDRPSILGLSQIEFSSEWRAAVVSSLARDGAAARRPPIEAQPGDSAGEEESGHRSFLGLSQIEFSSEWRAAVAASSWRPAAAADRKLVRPVEPLAASGDEEDSSHDLLLGLERSEFAFGRKPAAPAALPGPIAVGPAAAPARPSRSRGRLAERDLLSLREPQVPAEIDVPQFERDLTLQTVQPIPVERAILLSVAAHILLVFLLLWAPLGRAPSSRGGLLAGLIPEPPPPDSKIPIVFRSAPGPERENATKSDPSDKTRRAGGGERSRPKSDTPFVPERPGIEGLAPGAGKIARAAPSRRPAPASESEQRAAASSPSERSKAAPDAFAVPPPGASSSGASGPKLSDLQHAIQEAAREVGTSGEGGAGIPNPEGGFVDSGPISFDTSWYDWGAYADEMVRRIKLHWEIPELARLGWKGKLTIRFYILADGRVWGAKILSRSGVPPFDFAAFNAIVKSDPFKPLPRDLLAQVPGKDREGITVTFFYNIRPEKE